MGSGFYPQVLSILLAHGCTFVRQGKGSHEVWNSPINGRNFPLAVTVNSRNMANGVLRDAVIKRKI